MIAAAADADAVDEAAVEVADGMLELGLGLLPALSRGWASVHGDHHGITTSVAKINGAVRIHDFRIGSQEGTSVPKPTRLESKDTGRILQLHDVLGHVAVPR